MHGCQTSRVPESAAQFLWQRSKRKKPLEQHALQADTGVFYHPGMPAGLLQRGAQTAVWTVHLDTENVAAAVGRCLYILYCQSTIDTIQNRH